MQPRSSMDNRGMSLFYEEMYGIDSESAKRIGAFMDEMASHEVIKSAMPWCKHGKKRVYIKLNSQNRFGAFKPAFNIYYDAEKNDIFVDTSQNTWGIIKFERLRRFGNSCFSGAKTRELIFDFMDDFYEKSRNW